MPGIKLRTTRRYMKLKIRIKASRLRCQVLPVYNDDSILRSNVPRPRSLLENVLNKCCFIIRVTLGS